MQYENFKNYYYNKLYSIFLITGHPKVRNGLKMCLKQPSFSKWSGHLRRSYLYKENDEKVKICNSSKLLKQILWEEIPKCILCKDRRKNILLESKLTKC